MKQVNYILVNETAHKNSVCDVHHRFVPNIGQCIVVEAGSAQGSKSRTALIQKLIKLRKHYPEAKILGTSVTGHFRPVKACGNRIFSKF